MTALVVAGSVVGGAALLWPLGIWYEVRKCEKPKYALVRALASSKEDRRRFGLGLGQSAELRRYAPMLIAEVEVDGTMREASSSGFRKIARFIFGGNTKAGGGGGGESVSMTSPVRQELVDKPPSEPIAMTSPVVMAMGGSEGLPQDAAGKVLMSFVMPSKYTKDTLPRPNDDSVAIKEVPAHTVAALTFRGHVRDRAAVEAKKRQLLDILKAEGLAPEGDVTLMQYHPPFTYGWQRVNEVTFRVRE
ncbi:MAG: SOUL hem-binding protein [Monoraphidium minutum]|nr:MAG: SOUL hem-binding protein [Monoraphidium minutum]